MAINWGGIGDFLGSDGGAALITGLLGMFGGQDKPNFQFPQSPQGQEAWDMFKRYLEHTKQRQFGSEVAFQGLQGGAKPFSADMTNSEAFKGGRKTISGQLAENRQFDFSDPKLFPTYWRQPDYSITGGGKGAGGWGEPPSPGGHFNPNDPFDLGNPNQIPGPGNQTDPFAWMNDLDPAAPLSPADQQRFIEGLGKYGNVVGGILGSLGGPITGLLAKSILRAVQTFSGKPNEAELIQGEIAKIVRGVVDDSITKVTDPRENPEARADFIKWAKERYGVNDLQAEIMWKEWGFEIHKNPYYTDPSQMVGNGVDPGFGQQDLGRGSYGRGPRGGGRKF